MINHMMLEGGLTLTCLNLCADHDCDADNTCLLTARGKDHELTADDCEELAAKLLEAAKILRGEA